MQVLRAPPAPCSVCGCKSLFLVRYFFSLKVSVLLKQVLASGPEPDGTELLSKKNMNQGIAFGCCNFFTGGFGFSVLLLFPCCRLMCKSPGRSQSLAAGILRLKSIAGGGNARWTSLEMEVRGMHRAQAVANTTTTPYYCASAMNWTAQSFNESLRFKIHGQQ